jgi:hypothetical protein
MVTTQSSESQDTLETKISNIYMQTTMQVLTYNTVEERLPNPNPPVKHKPQASEAGKQITQLAPSKLPTVALIIL